MPFEAIDALPAVHPGEILADELEALGLSIRRFAAHIGVPPNAVSAIINGQRSVSPQMAQRLGRAFGTSARYWMNLQLNHDEKRAREEMQDALSAIEPLVAP